MPIPRPIGIRAAKSNFSALLDEVAAGEHVLVCRRSKPLAALIPAGDLDQLRELANRDAQLAAVLRARGHDIEPWGTARVIEIIVTHLGAST